MKQITADGRSPRKEGRVFVEPYGMVKADNEGSELEIELLTVLHQELPGITYGMLREFRFNPPAIHKFDFAWPDIKIAIEIEGGLYSGGRHTRGAGYEADLIKYNEAVLRGWIVLRFGTNHVRRERESSLMMIRRAFNIRKSGDRIGDLIDLVV